ncbi:N-acetylmuramoyl-L-alanine amidase [Bacillus sp. OK048]|uniref:N-acetylmuramoyl-L-alanine amidase n=1 Tax=Bacillus sp. OK048 TaxID=1882761 RepID=UPI000889EF0F|nr:N-acetylmuramoyl-L-alanine amidase [Bacillus sp. OK048]SDM69763.1 N-acetylmuramoyl-L-alanine amidase [Bacillus sp. OK048]
MKYYKNIFAILLFGISLLLYIQIPQYASAQTTEMAKGYLDNPVSGATLIGTKEVSGWFLDGSGVASIEVLVDGTVVGQATYGDARTDVQSAFPEFNNGNAGFHYALDTTKFSDGQHTLSIRETGMNGRVTTLPGSTITISNANTKGYVDNPVSGATLIGTKMVSGWFLDGSGVARIEVLLDNKVVGQATYGDARPDVRNAYPEFNNGNAGFHFALDTTKFSDGQYTVSIRETSTNGRITTLPGSTINISNDITRGYLDNPVSGTTLIGTKMVSGWFLDGSVVAEIEVLVDNKVVGQATYGDARPDVRNAYPEFNNGNAGFHFALDTTQFNDGQHTVSIRETSKNGRITTIPASTVTITNDITRGYIDNPVPDATLIGTKTVSGWFLDGIGVAKIEVLVDGSLVGEATYGNERTDVHKAFPEFNNGNAGFHYELDTTKFSDGQHTVTIRETAANGRVTTLPAVSVSFANVKAYVDNPIVGATLTGTKNISGWFLDASGVAKIEVLMDGTLVGEATYGAARTDVEQAFPDFNNGNAGFHYALDTTQFQDGQHTVTIRETATNGRVTTLPEIPVTVANVKGYMDNPIPGTILRGTKTISGWFLDTSGVTKIEVLVDGSVVGEATYGASRSDVQHAFPDFNNGNAGFHYELDTTQFPDGQHTITIRATGTNGRVTTLPVSHVKFRQSLKVFLDPGHGGSDPGAIWGSYHEADLNLAVAKKVQALLLNQGYEVYMSRQSDTYLGLIDRPQMANNLATDIYVSIHTNSTGLGAATASGIESYYYKYYPNYPSKINEAMHNNPERVLKSVVLTNMIQENMVSYTGANNRGTDGETFAVIREAAMPATLLEMGFINNANERQKLFTDSYQNQLAQAIADGIHEYFRIY